MTGLPFKNKGPWMRGDKRQLKDSQWMCVSVRCRGIGQAKGQKSPPLHPLPPPPFLPPSVIWANLMQVSSFGLNHPLWAKGGVSSLHPDTDGCRPRRIAENCLFCSWISGMERWESFHLHWDSLANRTTTPGLRQWHSSAHAASHSLFNY